MKIMRLLLAVALFGLAPLSGQNPTPSNLCEMSAAVMQGLNALPDMTDFRLSYEERMKPVRALAEKHPNDIFAQLKYQDSFRGRRQLYQEYDRAFEMYRARKEDIVARYLESRLTASFNPVKAEQMLQDIVFRAPDFAWAHWSLAELTDRLGRRDPEKAATHLRVFLKACPSALEGYSLLRNVDDAEMIAEGAKKLRILLEPRTDKISRPYWRTLWDLEFRAAPKQDQEQVRQRVLGDIARLQKLPPADSNDWMQIFRYGAEVTKSQEITDWMESTILKQYPRSPLAIFVERSRWSRMNPPPARDANQDEQRAYSLLQATRMEELYKRWPDDPGLILDKWLRLRSSPITNMTETLALADKRVALQQRIPDYSMSVPPLAVELADLYVKWRVRLDLVPGLVQAGLRDVELENKYSMDPSALPKEMQANRNDPVEMTNRRVRFILADLYLIQKQPDKARDAIQLGLEDIPVPTTQPPTEKELLQQQYARREWWPYQARLAVLQGDPQRALPLYQQYLQPMSKQIFSASVNLPAEMKELISTVKDLYLANGGKEEDWVAWASSGPKLALPTAGAYEMEFQFVLPDFEGKDLKGKTWRLSDLKGKATFIDIWATWCGPCRAEHPELQKLQNLIKDRKDIQVLTFSLDENEFLAESYMKEKGYTFPVIVSKGIIDKLFTTAGVPQGWIVDAQGRRSMPFRLSTAERVIAELEKAAKK
jgi:thiol-disulfide isomerase/thioredoxin